MLEANIINFLYTDAAGTTTRRQVTIKSMDEIYLRGWCEYSRGYRTFRRDRIKPTNDPLSLDALTYPTPHKNPAIKQPALMQVHFTGFKSSDKTYLTQRALQANMEVRQSVTAGLGILVYGYNASKNKLAKAEQQGALILTEEQFFELLDTGELPDQKEDWKVSNRHQGYYWQIYLNNVAAADEIIKQCNGKPFVFWRSFTQNTEIMVIDDDSSNNSEIERAKHNNIPVITTNEFANFIINKKLYPPLTPIIPPYILYRGTGDDGDIIDPIAFFKDFAHEIKTAHYPAFNIELDSQRILGRKPRIELRNCYSLRKRDWLDFHEGDIFHRIGSNETEGLKLIAANIDQIEVMAWKTTPKWSAIGYHTTPEQLVDWLKTGNPPTANHQISKHQSHSAIAQWHEYSLD